MSWPDCCIVSREAGRQAFFIATHPSLLVTPPIVRKINHWEQRVRRSISSPSSSSSVSLSSKFQLKSTCSAMKLSLTYRSFVFNQKTSFMLTRLMAVLIWTANCLNTIRHIPLFCWSSSTTCCFSIEWTNTPEHISFVDSRWTTKENHKEKGKRNKNCLSSPSNWLRDFLRFLPLFFSSSLSF